MHKVSFILLLTISSYYTAKAQNGWNVLTSNTTLDLLKVQCLADDTIFIFGDNGILLTSYDGGSNFNTKLNGTAAIYSAGYFKDIDTGFAGTGGGNIIRTTNGGGQWAITGGCTCFINDICFSNQSIGLYAGLAGVRRTTDGGSTWGSTSIASAGGPTKIIALDDSVFVSYDNFSFYKSTDAGLNFTSDTVHYLSNYPINGMSFIDSQTGFVITGDGYLYKTSDQGGSWNMLTTVNHPSTVFLDFLDSLNGFLVAGNLRRTIYKTVDGGLNWTTEFTASNTIESLSHHGASVYVCGQGGLVLKKNASLINVSEIDGLEFSIYPNPVQDVISIRFPGDIYKSYYQILDLSGRVILHGKISADNEAIDVSYLSEGLYYFKIDGVGEETFEIWRK